jgi:hypothetical protein
LEKLFEQCAESAAGVTGSTVPHQEAGTGSRPSAALQSTFGARELEVKPVTATVARRVCEARHYLHTYPGGAVLNFGVFVGNLMLGVAVLGVGPTNLHRLIKDAKNHEVVCLARLWLDDRLGRNSESRALGVILRMLKRGQTTVRAVVAYSDPLAGHTGTIYRASGFFYLGESRGMPLYKFPDGSVHHSRSLSHSYGTHSRKHFASFGVEVELVRQSPKHTYVALIDQSWQARLTRPVIPIFNERSRLMKIVDLPLGSIQPAAWNPNEMNEAMLAHLRCSIQRFGLVVPLVVRRLGSGRYETIGGAQRLTILKELNLSEASCVVVAAADDEARLLRQTLNHIAGSDNLGLRAQVLREILASIPQEEVLALLPDTAASLQSLSAIGEQSIAQALQYWEQTQKTRLRHLAFQLTNTQFELVEGVLQRLLPLTAGSDARPNKRGTALYLLCLGYLERESSVNSSALEER